VVPFFSSGMVVTLIEATTELLVTRFQGTRAGMLYEKVQAIYQALQTFFSV
jgi:hypothetical protein